MLIHSTVLLVSQVGLSVMILHVFMMFRKAHNLTLVYLLNSLFNICGKWGSPNR